MVLMHWWHVASLLWINAPEYAQLVLVKWYEELLLGLLSIVKLDILEAAVTSSTLCRARCRM